jgi:DNA-binding transcriptional regulator of glucitol operon
MSRDVSVLLLAGRLPVIAYANVVQNEEEATSVESTNAVKVFTSSQCIMTSSHYFCSLSQPPLETKRINAAHFKTALAWTLAPQVYRYPAASCYKIRTYLEQY